LLSGNYELYEATEQLVANFHTQETALIFNSGYSANIGFFSTVPQRGDVVFYDELIHASISGDSPNLVALADFCTKNEIYLIVDEAHALGVFGKKGCGLVQSLGIQHQVFAQIITYGKGLGCHGAAILGSADLKNYLVNFSRSLIYTTALPPHAIASIQAGYRLLSKEVNAIETLRENIAYFNQKILEFNLTPFFIESNSAIHCCIVSGVSTVKKIASEIQQQGFDVKPILSPTVSVGKERLRICLHNYNTFKEIETILKLVSQFLKA